MDELHFRVIVSASKSGNLWTGWLNPGRLNPITPLMVREILLPSFPVALPFSARTQKPLKWHLMPQAFRLLILLFAFPLRLFSQEPVASPTPKVTLEDLQLLQSTLKWKHGKIPLGSDLATIDVPASFRYLDQKDTESVLVKMWGNPPEEAKHILGMIFPDDVEPLD